MISINPVEQMLIGVMLLQTLTALVNSMAKPKREDGFYAYWFRFLHTWTNLADAYFEKKFNVTLPRVVDESASTPTAPNETPHP